MSKKKRKENERLFPIWIELENGNRLYSKEKPAGDNTGKKAVYEKLVDKEENTISFCQKIYDKTGQLIEIHEKYPIDKGHIILVVLFGLFVGILTHNFV